MCETSDRTRDRPVIRLAIVVMVRPVIILASGAGSESNIESDWGGSGSDIKSLIVSG